jgi:hypothetical protein
MPQSPLFTSSTTTQVTPRMFSPSISTIVSVGRCTISRFCAEADETIAARWRSAMAGWRELLESVAAAWVGTLDAEPPLSPKGLATLVSNVFQGIEVELLAGVTAGEASHREVLEALGAVIERWEAATTPARG